MGILVGKAYPTQMAIGLADHTYVECSTGKVGWSCWGGKSGGREIVRGTGSTKQAKAIANTNERAGITCYGINGVCHQAANRILWPTGSLVSAARGYWVSSSLYTTYGKENRNWLHICEASFDQHNNITGDLAACVPPKTAARSEALIRESTAKLIDADLAAERKFSQQAMALHTQLRAVAVEGVKTRKPYQLEHFSLQSEYRLGKHYTKTLAKSLTKLRTAIDKEHQEIDQAYADKQFDITTFAEHFNQLTIKFQDYMAETLTPEYYRAYLGLERTERVILLDPEIINEIQAGKQ